jgi:hypothetical protein
LASDLRRWPRGVFEDPRKDFNRLLAVPSPVVIKVDKVTTILKTKSVKRGKGRFRQQRKHLERIE